MSDKARTWLITGCSSGPGRALARELIVQGQRVFATARNPAQLAALVDGHDNATALKLDVTSAQDVAAGVAAVEQAGRVDVLVNNAGYGYRAAVEEGEHERIDHLFATNVFGPLSMIKAVLPGMRARHSGTIVNNPRSPDSRRISLRDLRMYGAMTRAFCAAETTYRKHLEVCTRLPDARIVVSLAVHRAVPEPRWPPAWLAAHSVPTRVGAALVQSL